VDPILSRTAQAVTRIAVGAEPAREPVLREGRVVAGEVLARTAGGDLLIALGRLRIPAQNQAQLDVGARFLARVVADAHGLALEIIGQVPAAADGAFFDALRAVIGEQRPISELLTALAARLAAEGGEGWERALSNALDSHVLRPGADGRALATLLGRAGLGYEAALAFLARRGATPERLQELTRDLKHELLRALGESTPGPARDAVLQALAGLEAEQLLNVARQKTGEPALWSVPVPDARGLATARLLVRRRGERSAGPERSPSAVACVVLGVCFTSTGALISRSPTACAKSSTPRRASSSTRDWSAISSASAVSSRMGGTSCTWRRAALPAKRSRSQSIPSRPACSTNIT
jgi:hypothetical protein